MADYQYSLLGSPMSLCRYDDPCCFRRNRDQMCRILTDTKFFDEQCHFRKARIDGPNLYELDRRATALQVAR